MSVGDRPSQGVFRAGWFIPLGILLLSVLVVATCNLWVSSRLMRQQREESRQHAFWVLCQPGYGVDVRKNAFLLLVAEGNREWRSAALDDLDLEKAALA